MDPPIVNLQKYGVLCCIPVLESSQYSKARVIAMDECRSSIDVGGVHALGKKGLVLVCKCLDETSAETRSAAVEVISAVLKKMNSDRQRLFKVCGSVLSSKGRAILIEHWEKHSGHDVTNDVSCQPRSTRKSRRSSLLSPAPPIGKPKTLYRKSSKRDVPLNLRLGDESRESLTGLSTNHLSNLTTESGPFTFQDPSTTLNSSNSSEAPGESLQIDVPPRIARDVITDISPATYTTSNASGLSSSVHSGAAASLRARLKQIRQKHQSSNVDNPSEIVASETKAVKNEGSSSDNNKAIPYVKKTSISDIFNSIDNLLRVTDSVSESSPELNVGIECIRHLHSSMTSPPSMEAASPIRREIEKDLAAPMDRLIRYVFSEITSTSSCIVKNYLTQVFFCQIRSLEFGFKHGELDIQAGLLVNLLSVTLATLMAIFRDPNLAIAVPETSLTQLIREASLALLDSRLASSSFPSNGIDSTTATHLVRAINKLAILAAISSPRHIAFQSLMSLQLQFCSGAIYEVGNQRLARVIAKLFARVIKAEEATSYPFSDVDLESILCSLDDTLVACNVKTEIDMSPCTDLARSLLTAVLKAQDIKKLVVVMSDLGMDVEESRLGILLSSIENPDKISRKGDVPRGDDKVPNIKSSASEGDTSVGELTKLVSNISLSVGDKERRDAIENLRYFVKAHPEIDINVHLAKVSFHFRSHILEQLETETKKSSQTDQCDTSDLRTSEVNSRNQSEVSR